MRARFLPAGAVLMCAALTACAQVANINPARPTAWQFGYTMLEDPASVSSQITACLSNRLDPRCFEQVRGRVRITTTTRTLCNQPDIDGFYDKERQRVMYREHPPGFVAEETIVHEIMHWVYATGRMCEPRTFHDDLSRYLAEEKDDPFVRKLIVAWEATSRVCGQDYDRKRDDEFYALIGGLISAGEGCGDGASPLPDYIRRHYRGILSSARLDGVASVETGVAPVCSRRK